MENKFFDPIFWGGLMFLMTSLIWLIVGIIWSMIRKSKWIEIGRQLERQEPQSFRKQGVGHEHIVGGRPCYLCGKITRLPAPKTVVKRNDRTSICIYCPPVIDGGIPKEAIKAWHNNGHPRSTPVFADFEGALVKQKKGKK